MPHSLGHFIGYRVHDVGYHKFDNFELQKQYQVLTECILVPGITLTVEPGVYFIQRLINQTKNSLKSKFLNFELIKEYSQEIGGI